jgi:hypothetical protein
MTGTGRTAGASNTNADVTTAVHARRADSGHLKQSANLITLFLELAG